ncbi:hypothetical protein [Ectothiorhodospira shaposhnikovii]|uniref:hypothetical protein n=1 Tax=Ectothiorhodospira shaposhnikovii TaxID=1054 RepID=UPI001A912E44|nr:hypothetical protein [Ectothiorhodospira shaposhnikovii]
MIMPTQIIAADNDIIIGRGEKAFTYIRHVKKTDKTATPHTYDTLPTEMPVSTHVVPLKTTHRGQCKSDSMMAT